MTDDELRPIGDMLAQARRRLGRPGLDEAREDDPSALVEIPAEVVDLTALRDRGVGRLQSAWWLSVVPARFVRAQTSDFTPAVAETLEAWARAPLGRNLVIFGPIGTGKSHAAVAAVRPGFEDHLEVRFYPVDELLDSLRPGGPEDALYQLADVERLVIDDLGSERVTEWTADRVFALLNRRWLEMLPTVVTSNLTPEQLEAHVGPRAYSRLVGSDAVVVRLSGQDRRRS